MPRDLLTIVVLGGIAALTLIPSFRDAILFSFARRQGETIQRQITGGKLFDEAGADIQRQITDGQTFLETSNTISNDTINFGEKIQKNLFGGLLFP